MADNRFTAEFCAKTVLGFCRFSPDSLSALANDLSLTLNQAGLLHCQRYFAGEAGRDPTIGELRLIAALSARTGSLPAAVSLAEINLPDTNDARVFADLMRQRKALGKENSPTLADLATTATAYLARAGRKAKAIAGLSLHVGENADIAARSDAARLTLSVGEISAALLAPKAHTSRAAGDFLLVLRPTSDKSLDRAVADFFAQFGAYHPAPLALIGPEGLSVHLAALPMGAELDLMPLADFDALRGAPALLDACAHSLLLTCPQSAAMAMLQMGAPLTLIGRLTAGDNITARYGMQPLCTISRKFLATFRVTHHVKVTLPAPEAAPFTGSVACTENDTARLCGTKADDAPEAALSALLAAMTAIGTRMENAVLGTVLTLPLGADSNTIAGAVSLLLPLHRFAAELALPTAALRIVTGNRHSAPSLTLFLAAPKDDTVSPIGDEIAAALRKSDFAAARRLLYPRVAGK